MKLDNTQKIQLILNIENAVRLAENGQSGMNVEILKGDGESGVLGRLMHHNLARIFGKDLSYLEVGTKKGLSFCTALANNEFKYACVIDNWCEGEFRKEFNETINKYLKDVKFDLYDQDCWTINLKEQIKEKINFYFYDTCHTRESQGRALSYYNESLDDVFLYMVDDWNEPAVRAGTYDGFKAMDYKVLYDRQLFTENYNNRISPGAGNGRTWWNGLYIAVIEKP